MTEISAEREISVDPVFPMNSRLVTYFRLHGFRATVHRMALAVRRLLSPNRMILFYLDLNNQQASPARVTAAGDLVIERKRSREEFDRQDWETIVNFWNPALSQRSFLERFRSGASVWIARLDGRVAGYGWTMIGRTIAPHYYPLGGNDVHMFDFLVFPEFRGKGVNPSLVSLILNAMAEEGRIRAYIEVREWNQPQLNSLGKTGFQLLGVARKMSLSRCTFVQWIPQEKLPCLAGFENKKTNRLADALDVSVTQ